MKIYMVSLLHRATIMKKENELTVQLAKMRMIRRMCDIKVGDKFTRS